MQCRLFVWIPNPPSNTWIAGVCDRESMKAVGGFQAWGGSIGASARLRPQSHPAGCWQPTQS
eukprot:5547073-Alexandrium_andersonii.AAC.1